MRKIDVHYLTEDAALDCFVARYNQFVAMGLTEWIEVVHGKGKGVLRRALRNFLDKHRGLLGGLEDGDEGHFLVRPGVSIPRLGDRPPVKPLAHAHPNRIGEPPKHDQAAVLAAYQRVSEAAKAYGLAIQAADDHLQWLFVCQASRLPVLHYWFLEQVYSFPGEQKQRGGSQPPDQVLGIARARLQQLRDGAGRPLKPPPRSDLRGGLGR